MSASGDVTAPPSRRGVEVRDKRVLRLNRVHPRRTRRLSRALACGSGARRLADAIPIGRCSGRPTYLRKAGARFAGVHDVDSVTDAGDSAHHLA
jgi:hypothetical protein